MISPGANLEAVRVLPYTDRLVRGTRGFRCLLFGRRWKSEKYLIKDLKWAHYVLVPWIEAAFLCSVTLTETNHKQKQTQSRSKHHNPEESNF